jgi:hypothetical protein
MTGESDFSELGAPAIQQRSSLERAVAADCHHPELALRPVLP